MVNTPIRVIAQITLLALIAYLLTTTLLYPLNSVLHASTDRSNHPIMVIRYRFLGFIDLRGRIVTNDRFSIDYMTKKGLWSCDDVPSKYLSFEIQVLSIKGDVARVRVIAKSTWIYCSFTKSVEFDVYLSNASIKGLNAPFIFLLDIRKLFEKGFVFAGIPLSAHRAINVLSESHAEPCNLVLALPNVSVGLKLAKLINERIKQALGCKKLVGFMGVFGRIKYRSGGNATAYTEYTHLTLVYACSRVLYPAIDKLYELAEEWVSTVSKTLRKYLPPRYRDLHKLVPVCFLSAVTPYALNRSLGPKVAVNYLRMFNTSDTRLFLIRTPYSHFVNVLFVKRVRDTCIVTTPRGLHIPTLLLYDPLTGVLVAGVDIASPLVIGNSSIALQPGITIVLSKVVIYNKSMLGSSMGRVVGFRGFELLPLTAIVVGIGIATAVYLVARRWGG